MFLKRVSLRAELKEGSKLQEMPFWKALVVSYKWDPNFKNWFIWQVYIHSHAIRELSKILWEHYDGIHPHRTELFRTWRSSSQI